MAASFFVIINSYMLGWNYQHDIIRKYVVMFGNMFNDIQIRRLDNNDNRIQTLAVPIFYGPKEKWLVRIGQDPNITRSVAVSLPLISFEMTGFNYDGDRKTSVNNVIVGLKVDDGDYHKTTYTPAPYDINMEMNIFVANADEGAQIVEQILPFFKPEYTQRINVLPELSLKMDIPIELNSVNLVDTYEADFVTRRAIMWTLGFTIKGYIYGPVSNKGVIKRVQVDTTVVPGSGSVSSSDIANHGRSERLVVVPGLLANGQPTTNSLASIPYNQITANDNFGFATNLYFYQDGMKYDPVSGTDKPIRTYDE